ncbi:MAG TPA: SigB/SigF/SigG family RNA polymerase sigma factor [bacterium]|nr:SigB/SigF/SigG family RNA polymerase sigma factor [bacterium]
MNRTVETSNVENESLDAQNSRPSDNAVVPTKRGSGRLSEAEAKVLFVKLRETNDPATREQLILVHQYLAMYFARRFRDRGEPIEDLTQVAQIGLINAVDRYDHTRGIRFGTYAAVTIIGELRRYFRDKVWAIHIPRRHRELNYRLMHAVEELRQLQGQSPSVEELAQHVGVPFDVAMEALDASRAYAPVSLDEDIVDGTSEDSVQRIEQIGGDDPAIARTDDLLALKQAWARLPESERTILTMRFQQELPQQQIAQLFQVSQMQISRVQRRALWRLRALIGE